MAYALSPGVTVIEKDFTSIVPSVSSSMGAFAGAFQWGPILYPVQLSTENELVQQFGKPSTNNFESFFTAANFMSYTSGMYITRIDNASGKNAVGNTSPLVAGTAVKIKNIDDYNTTYSGATNTFEWAAKYAGTLGNSLKVSFADSATFQNLSYIRCSALCVMRQYVMRYMARWFLCKNHLEFVHIYKNLKDLKIMITFLNEGKLII